VLILMHLRDLGARRTVAKALNAMQARILQKLGADEIVYPERDMGTRVARLLVEPEVLNVIPLGDGHRVEHLLLPARRDGTRVADLQRDPQVRILALRRGGAIAVHPAPDVALYESDELVVIGPNVLLARLHEEHGRR
jgi:trk system potassium uptake protein TrkA